MRALRRLLIVVGIFALIIVAANYHDRKQLQKKAKEEAARIEAGRHPSSRLEDFEAEAKKQTTDQLLADLQNSNINYQLRQSAKLELAMRKDPRFHEQLRTTLATSTDNFDLQDAAEYLGYFEDPEDFAVLRKLADNPENPAAPAALASLGRLHDQRALPVLTSAWNKGPEASMRDESIRFGAAQGLGLYGPEGLALLLKHLGKVEYAERPVISGVSAATAADVPGALAALIDLSERYGTSFTKKDTAVLASRQEPEAQEAFRKLLHNQDKSVRLAAVEGIKETDSRAVDLYATLLNDPDPGIQETVGQALFDIDTPASCALLDRAMAEKDLGVVVGAYERFMPVRTPAEIPVIAAAMEQAGDESIDKGMATALLNDSHPELSKAANDWASAHNYNVIQEFHPIPR